MKNINWKLRFKNKATLLAIAGTLILLAQQLGLKLPDNIEDVVNTVLTLLVLLGLSMTQQLKELVIVLRH